MGSDRRVEAEAENRLALAFVAFGQGAGPIRTSRTAVAALREHYWPALLRVVGKEMGGRGEDTWPATSADVLDYVRAIGRLAADLATARGVRSVEAADVLAAVGKVEGVKVAAGMETKYCSQPSPVTRRTR